MPVSRAVSSHEKCPARRSPRARSEPRSSRRLLHAGLPFLTASTVGAATAAARDPRLAPVLAGTLALWRPLTRLAGSERAYEQHFLPYMHDLLPRRLATDTARVLGGLGLVAAVRRYLPRPH